mmetsp:Transcript_1192/g.2935  ORF Transcript_1192/g.2935 Transcript_1192/m.2935 type:complete len:586 (+) Transcript_1192:2604-4361(+)
MTRMALSLMLLGALGCMAYNLNDQVIDVTSEDFEQFQNEFRNSFRLFVFYGSFSAESREFFGAMYRVSRKLKEYYPHIVIAKIDLSVGDNKKLASLHEVPSLPSLSFYLQGSSKPHLYNGKKEERAIVSYALDTLFKIHTFDTHPAFEEFVSSKSPLDGVILGVFPDRESLEYLAFEAYARENMHRFRFAEAINQIDFEAQYTTKGASIVVVKGPLLEGGMGAFSTTPALSSEKEIEDWIAENFFGFIGHYTPQNEHFFSRTGKPVVVLYFDFDINLNPSIIKYYVNKFRRSVSQMWNSPLEHENRFEFAIANKEDYRPWLEREYLITNKALVVIRLKGSNIVFKEPQVLTDDQRLKGDAINQACFDYINGKLSEYIKSEPEPDKAYENDVRVVVGSTLTDTVWKSDKNVLLLLYALWNPEYQTLIEIFEKLGAEYNGSEDVLITKLEGMSNEHNYGSNLPSIIFHPAIRKSEWNRYGGEFTYDEVKKFFLEEKAKEDEYKAELREKQRIEDEKKREREEERRKEDEEAEKAKQERIAERAKKSKETEEVIETENLDAVDEEVKVPEAEVKPEVPEVKNESKEEL